MKTLKFMHSKAVQTAAVLISMLMVAAPGRAQQYGDAERGGADAAAGAELESEGPGPDIDDNDAGPGNEGTLAEDEEDEVLDRAAEAARRERERVREAWERTAGRIEAADGDAYDWDVAKKEGRRTAEALRLMERKADRFRNHLKRMRHMHDVMQQKRNPQLAERLNAMTTLETLRFLLEFGELARENPEAARLFDMESYLPAKGELKIPGEALKADLAPFEKRLKQMGIEKELLELQGRTVEELQEELERDYFFPKQDGDETAE